MICIIMILLSGWCRMRMRPARLVSYAFLYTTFVARIQIMALRLQDAELSDHTFVIAA